MKRNIDQDTGEKILKLLHRLVSPLGAIQIQTDDSTRVLRPEDIAFIRVDDKRILFFDIEGNQGSRFESLSSMEEKLKEDERFFKSHRSCLVNIYHIKSIEKADRENFLLTFKGKCTEKAFISETKLLELKKILFTV